MSAAPPQLVVLGSIWVPPEYSAAAKGGQIFYGGHPELYSAPVHQHHYHSRGASSGVRVAIAPSREVKRGSSEEGGSSDSTDSTEEDEDGDGDGDVEEKGWVSVAQSDEEGKKLSRIRLKI